jgi:hypothetical protein
MACNVIISRRLLALAVGEGAARAAGGSFTPVKLLPLDRNASGGCYKICRARNRNGIASASPAAYSPAQSR